MPPFGWPPCVLSAQVRDLIAVSDSTQASSDRLSWRTWFGANLSLLRHFPRFFLCLRC